MYKKGDNVKGTVTGIKQYGAFVKFQDGSSGLIHISEFSDGYVKKLEDFVKVGDEIEVQVIEFNEEIQKYNLSIKKAAGKLSKSKKEVINLTIGFDSLEKALDGWVEKKEKKKNE